MKAAGGPDPETGSVFRDCPFPDCESQSTAADAWCFVHRPGDASIRFLEADSPPSEVTTYPGGGVWQEVWRAASGASRIGGPAYRTYTPEGSLRGASWLLDGKSHREDGPAHEAYYEDGSLYIVSYYRHGVLHRLDGPAEVIFREDGSPQFESWWAEGQAHRLDGPAATTYGADGQPDQVRFSIRGVDVRAEAFPRYTEALAAGAPDEWARAYAEGLVG